MKQKYKITENLSDHPTYTGQELTIDLNLGNDYYELVDIDGNRFMAGEEELTKIAIPSTPVNDKQEQTEGFTPGEWEYEQTRGNNRYEHHVFSRNGGKYGSYVIAQLGMEDTGEVEPEVIKANAKLIASAPNLYRDNAQLKELLQWIVNEIETTPDELSDALLGMIKIKIRKVRKELLSNIQK